jgi:hypothetical protein
MKKAVLERAITCAEMLHSCSQLFLYLIISSAFKDAVNPIGALALS